MSTVETTIANTQRDIARIPQLVAGLAVTHRLSSNVVSDLNVALDEVLSNIIKYGYTDDRVHTIRVRLTVSRDLIEAEIEDDGVPFNPLTSPEPDVRAPLNQRRIGGLGIHFAKNLMTEISYNRVGDRNRLVLRKNLMA